MTAVTAGFVLRRATAFLEDSLSNPDARRRALSAARRRLPSPADPAALHALSLLSETLDSSFHAAADAVSGGKPSSLSALLLAVSLALRRRDADAARSLLDIFTLDPASARADIAPQLFEELFLPHLYPVVRWFSERRSQILSSKAAVLSRMSGGQAAGLRELERTYEGVMDENSRVYAGYLKELLRSGDGIRPPELILPRVDAEEEEIEEAEEESVGKGIGSTNGRFNPIWAEADQSVEFSAGHMNKEQSSYTMVPSLYPQRVPPQILLRQPPNESIDNRRQNISSSGQAFPSCGNCDESSSEAQPDVEEEDRKNGLLKPKNHNRRQKPTSMDSSMNGKKLIFVTNNSTKSRRQYARKFRALGLDVEEEEIFSSSFAAAMFLKLNDFPRDKKVYVIGEEGILEELELAGFTGLGGPEDGKKTIQLKSNFIFEHDKNVGAVIVGLDQYINYYKLQYATLCIRENPGCLFIATNRDAVGHLTDMQEWPGAGCMVSAICGSVQKEPIVVGKPSYFLMDFLLERYQIDTSKMCMIGDRLDTDILFGKNAGCKTLLVLSGCTTLSGLKDSSNIIYPDYYTSNVSDIVLLSRK